ncbi:ABC transporter permease [Gordonia rubripertincta]|uniref:ABC transporter permease n=1 Tax=Gordonia rubripertincta TaxID=36822 RepID=A0ABT4N492_GORRU|nr:ABC transporter permease [Gordonia rubripertincta]MCZ4553136.1 ABC transporter permease [Gordonia rubripertincta]
MPTEHPTSTLELPFRVSCGGVADSPCAMRAHHVSNVEGEAPVVSALRIVWWGLAAAAVVFTVWTAMSPAGGVSLSCSKSGQLDLEGSRAALQCDDSVLRVVGVWPLVQLGQLLAIPPAVAALVMKRWVSWLVVATFVVLTFIAVANWSSFWVSLGFAVPMFAIGLLAASAQHIVQPARSESYTQRT